MTEERDSNHGTDPIPASGQQPLEGATSAPGEGEAGDSGAPEPEASPASAPAEPKSDPAAGPKPEEPTPLDRANARIAELEQRADKAEAEAKDNRNKMLRVAADFENYRKRAARDADEARARGQTRALSVLLPVFDNLERAAAHVDSSKDAASVGDGIRLVMKQFIEAVAKLDVQRIEALGQPFDPALHESIQYDYDDAIAAGLVAKELQPGYKQGAALLRPALVVVSKGPAPAKQEAPAQAAPAEESAPAQPKDHEPQ